MKVSKWLVASGWRARLLLGLFVVAASLVGLIPAASGDHNATTLVSAGGNGDFFASFADTSTDGARVFFLTSESLVSGDTDTSTDVYERAGGTTTLISTGPSGGNGPFDASNPVSASDDGARAFFLTSESLVSGDTDTKRDVYERAGGTTTLISTGPAGGNGAFDVPLFLRTSDDGTRVFFETNEKLVAGDTDGTIDVYERAGGATTLISTGPAGGNGAFSALFRSASVDGTRAFFETDERLVAGDTDTSLDFYERAGSTTTLISTGPAGGNGAFDVSFSLRTSDDGTRVFFETDEKLVAGDTDTSTDVYERANATTTLISTGPAGGNGAFNACCVSTSVDGTRAFFHTEESLVAGDTDEHFDTYMRAGGTTTLISTGLAGGNGAFDAFLVGTSDDGSRAFFRTKESLVAGDTDPAQDIYQRLDAKTILISTGPAGRNVGTSANFKGVTPDGKRVFFDIAESLVAGDNDDNGIELYERVGAATTLISTGPAEGEGGFFPILRGMSEDGTHVFFDTHQQLVAGDTDTNNDVYERSIDLVAPDTVIDSGPQGTTTDNTPTFTFSAPEPDVTFECRTDEATFAACISPHTTIALDDGLRTFEVRAVDQAGNADPTPASLAFTVDAQAPDTTIDSGPEATTPDNTPTFTFSASETDATFECRIVDAAFAPCTSPFSTTALADGARTFEVQATDAVGHTDPTPASLAFTIDTQAPDTTINTGPQGTTTDNTPTFTFSASEAATFECRIDAADFAPCTSPDTTIALADALHTFEVRATDVVGHIDPTPATRAFTINTEGLVGSKVTIAFDRPGGTFSGRVTATTGEPDLREACLEGRRVVLRQKTPGKDPVGGRAKTDAGGRWRIEGFETAVGRYYAVVKGKVLEQDDETVTCGLDRSRTISI